MGITRRPLQSVNKSSFSTTRSDFVAQDERFLERIASEQFENDRAGDVDALLRLSADSAFIIDRIRQPYLCPYFTNGMTPSTRATSQAKSRAKDIRTLPARPAICATASAARRPTGGSIDATKQV